MPMPTEPEGLTAIPFARTLFEKYAVPALLETKAVPL